MTVVTVLTIWRNISESQKICLSQTCINEFGKIFRDELLIDYIFRGGIGLGNYQELLHSKKTAKNVQSEP